MEGNSTIRPGLKARYRQPEERARSLYYPERFDGFKPGRDWKGQRHLPFLHLELPYTFDTLFDLLLGDIRPVVNADITNNGNALATMPTVELVTTLKPFGQPAEISGWVTAGVLSVGPLYPHQRASVGVAWDWLSRPLFLSWFRHYWALHFRALCYDPVLDPRPDPALPTEDQSPFHTKVVTIQSLTP